MSATDTPGTSPARGYEKTVTQTKPERDPSGRGVPNPPDNRPQRDGGFGGGTETKTSPFHSAGSGGDPDER